MKSKLLFALLLLMPCASTAQPVRSLSLDELFRLGSGNSLRLAASRIGESLAGEQELDARTGRLPDIRIGATTGYLGQPVVFRQGLTRPSRPESPDWLYNYNISVVQPLYEGGRIRCGIQRAALQRRIAALTVTDDEAEVRMLLLRHYLDLFSLYKQRELFARNIEEAERRLGDIRRMRNEGLVTRNDEIRSELELTNFRLSSRETDDNIAIVSQQLDLLLGLDESLLLKPDTVALAAVSPLGAYADYVEEACDNYPGLNIARRNIDLARTDVRIARSAYLPSLSLQGANTLARPLTTTMQDLFANNWNIQLSLSFNLSSLYRNRHKVQEARYQAALSENREQQVLQELRIRVRSAYIRHREALERVESLRLAEQQAEENYRIVRNRYLNQLSILTDLLDANGIRLQTELQLTAARAETVYTYYELLRACGNL